MAYVRRRFLVELLPRAIPDEPALAHAGRVMRLNGLPSLAHLTDFAETRFKSPNKREKFDSVLSLLSSISEM